MDRNLFDGNVPASFKDLNNPALSIFRITIFQEIFLTAVGILICSNHQKIVGSSNMSVSIWSSISFFN